MSRLRASAGQVNTFMPRRPSLAFRSQEVRRKVWMLEARRQDLRPGRASKLSGIVLKLQKKVKYMCRQQHRIEFQDSLRRVFEVYEVKDESLLAQWSKYITLHQQAARAAGLKWATECYTKNDWAGQSTPSSQTLNEILLHLVKIPGYDYSTWSRSRLCSEARSLLHVYDSLPLEPGSEECKRARVRMIVDMMFHGVLEQEQAKGLYVSGEEVAEAQQALFPADDQRWGMLPLEMTPWFYKEKNILWAGVQSWSGLKECDLPLRSSAIAGADLLPPTIPSTTAKHNLKDKECEKPANLTKFEVFGNRDRSIKDIAKGPRNESNEQEIHGGEASSAFNGESNGYHKFGSPFPPPDDFTWVI
ncbi:MAG: hypothetical protein Q9178_007821 [Gyalolechia marmorata]